jgi:hypothetical protein
LSTATAIPSAAVASAASSAAETAPTSASHHGRVEDRHWYSGYCDYIVVIQLGGQRDRMRILNGLRALPHHFEGHGLAATTCGGRNTTSTTAATATASTAAATTSTAFIATAASAETAASSTTAAPAATSATARASTASGSDIGIDFLRPGRLRPQFLNLLLRPFRRLLLVPEIRRGKRVRFGPEGKSGHSSEAKHLAAPETRVNLRIYHFSITLQAV